MIGFVDAVRCPSANHGARKSVLQPSIIVIHYTGMKNVKMALERLCSPEFEVSSHYLISAQGEIFQLVSEDRRAWHAGVSYWRGWRDINSKSIGIELENDGDQPFPFPQMTSLISLCKDIQRRWVIWPFNVLGHSDIAISRKLDPGKKFDWECLARAGIGMWPKPPSADRIMASSESNFLEMADLVGYDTSSGLVPVLDAFRMRFSPCSSGYLKGSDCSLMFSLVNSFSIDQSLKIS